MKWCSRYALMAQIETLPALLLVCSCSLQSLLSVDTAFGGPVDWEKTEMELQSCWIHWRLEAWVQRSHCWSREKRCESQSLQFETNFRCSGTDLAAAWSGERH